MATTSIRTRPPPPKHAHKAFFSFIPHFTTYHRKGDYDGAMRQYLRTIGRLEPSYVIRKFLDAQRIHNLTSYLQVSPLAFKIGFYDYKWMV